MTQAQYAGHRGVSRATIARAIATGRIPFLKRTGRINPKRADRAWKENTDPAKQRGRHATNGAGGNGNATLYESKARREQALAALAELALAERRGELVPEAQVRKIGFERARRTRDQLLALPDQLAQQLVGITEYGEVHRILGEELRRVCDDIANQTDRLEGGAGEPGS